MTVRKDQKVFYALRENQENAFVANGRALSNIGSTTLTLNIFPCAITGTALDYGFQQNICLMPFKMFDFFHKISCVLSFTFIYIILTY